MHGFYKDVTAHKKVCPYYYFWHRPSEVDFCCEIGIHENGKWVGNNIIYFENGETHVEFIKLPPPECSCPNIPSSIYLK